MLGAYGNAGSAGGGSSPLYWVIVAVVAVVVIALVVWAVRRLRARTPTGRPSDRTRDDLDRAA